MVSKCFAIEWFAYVRPDAVSFTKLTSIPFALMLTCLHYWCCCVTWCLWHLVVALYACGLCRSISMCLLSRFLRSLRISPNCVINISVYGCSCISRLMCSVVLVSWWAQSVSFSSSVYQMCTYDVLSREIQLFEFWESPTHAFWPLIRRQNAFLSLCVWKIFVS